MKKYNCKIIYKNSYVVDAKNVVFKKLLVSDFKLDGEKLDTKLKGSILNKVNAITSVLALGNANIIVAIGGDAPHEDLVSHSGFWKVDGRGVLPNSYFPVVAQKDIPKGI